jgi:leucine dehydrogenase
VIQKYKSLPEFKNHEQIVELNDPASGLKGFIAIHRRFPPHPSFGATRMAFYQTKTDALKDALRLSALMSFKSIMAGLPYGGAKATIIRPYLTMPARQKLKLLAAYAKKVNDLTGRFITGADLGINEDDLKMMKKGTSYIVGLKSEPVPYTALGLFYSLEVALDEIFGRKSLGGRSFAIQGVGKIGGNFLKLIYPRAAKIFIADVDKTTLSAVKKQFPKVRIVSPKEIFSQNADVFSPCALGGYLNGETIKKIRSKIILGGANNQLASEKIGTDLYGRGILYAPDYVVNGGGLISVTDEYENPVFNKQRLVKKVKKIAETLKEIIAISKKQHRATNLVSDEIAQAKLNKTYEQATIARV